MTTPVTRPPRTAAHATRDALIAHFASVGLQPIVGTNGSVPYADIQQAKALLTDGGKYGEVVDCWITAHGEARLAAAQTAKEPGAFRREPVALVQGHAAGAWEQGE